jgi:hypothetical protein
MGLLYPVDDASAAREAFLSWKNVDMGSMSSQVTRDAYAVDGIPVDIIRSKASDELDGMFKSVLESMTVAHVAFTKARGFLRYGGDLKKILLRGGFGSGADTDPNLKARLDGLPEGTWFYGWSSMLSMVDSIYFNGMNPLFGRVGRRVDDEGFWVTFSAKDGTGVYAIDVPASTIASLGDLIKKIL